MGRRLFGHEPIVANIYEVPHAFDDSCAKAVASAMRSAANFVDSIRDLDTEAHLLDVVVEPWADLGEPDQASAQVTVYVGS